MKKEQLEQLEQLQALLRELAIIFACEEDVHRYTRRLGDICRQFIALDNQYIRSLENANSIYGITQEILARCPQNLKANVHLALNSINSFSGADGETMLPLQELLRRTWALKNSYPNGEDLIFENLNHNKIAGGGCLPGIAARLVQPYTAFLYKRLETLYHSHKTTQASPNKLSDLKDDEQLARALNASMNSLFKNQTKALTNHLEEEDDDDALLAQAISLSLTHVPKNAPKPKTPVLFSKTADDELQLAIKLSLDEAKKVQATKEAKESQEAADEEYALRLHSLLNN